MFRGMLTRKSTMENGVFLCCGAPEKDKRVRIIKIAGKKRKTKGVRKSVWVKNTAKKAGDRKQRAGIFYLHALTEWPLHDARTSRNRQLAEPEVRTHKRKGAWLKET